MDLQFEVVYFSPKLTDSLLIDLNLDLMLIFSTLLLVKQQGILGLNCGHLVIEAQEVMLEILQLEEFFLKGRDDCIFVLGLSLVKKVGSCKVAVHDFPIEIS